MSATQPQLRYPLELRELDALHRQEVLCSNIAETREQVSIVRRDILAAHAVASGLIAFGASWGAISMRKSDSFGPFGNVVMLGITSLVCGMSSGASLTVAAHIRNTGDMIIANCAVMTLCGVLMAESMMTLRQIVSPVHKCVARPISAAVYLATGLAALSAGTWWIHRIDKKLRNVTMTVPKYYE